jgi:hypothetical protein
MKYLKFGWHELAACIIIAFAILLRIFLASQLWPFLDSDEATFGLMAKHIAFNNEHPIFLDGYHYMGTLQSHIAALLYPLFGPTLFALRLGIILLVTLFFICVYFLTRALYNKNFALVVLALLSVGSHYVLEYQLHSYGGYPDTLFFGTLLFLCAFYLAFFDARGVPLRKRWWRYLAYACWGGAAGLGLWSDMLIAPFILTSGILILLFCWRELLRILPIVCILVGLYIGARPLISYNLHAAPGADSLSVLKEIHQGSSGELSYSSTLILKELKGTFQVSIPTITGNPFCPVSEQAEILHEPSTPHSLLCTTVHSAWSIGYVLLFVCAAILATLMAWKVSRNWWNNKQDLAMRQELVRHYGRWLLLACAFITLLLYTFSVSSIYWPGLHARYLIALIAAVPAVLWPLWSGITSKDERKRNKLGRIACTILLASVSLIYLTGTIMVFTELPSAQADYQRNLSLIQHLRSIGATHIYTEYWTCDKLAFISQEQIICGVVGGELIPSHNREAGYYDTVKADPHSAYVFPLGYQTPALQKKLSLPGAHYRYYVFDGYYIYQPI